MREAAQLTTPIRARRWHDGLVCPSLMDQSVRQSEQIPR